MLRNAGILLDMELIIATGCSTTSSPAATKKGYTFDTSVHLHQLHKTQEKFNTSPTYHQCAP